MINVISSLAAEGAKDSLAALPVRPPHVHLGRCKMENTFIQILKFLL